MSAAAVEPKASSEKSGSISLRSNADVKEEREDDVLRNFILDEAFERKLMRKLDWHLMPVISVMFMLSFLDRANIGNAFTAGLIKDLHFKGLQSNIASAVFFITYSTFEVPANMALKVLRPSRWIPFMMLAWGMVLTLMILVKSFNGLVIGRIFLGIAETGMFPGALYYTSLWYPRKAQAFRVSIFFSTAITGVAFGGILAFAIEKMDGVGGLHGWAWIFCLEGIVTCIVAVIAFFTVQDNPQTAGFLTEEERNYLITRLRQDSQDASTKFNWKFIIQAFTDPKVYLQMGIYAGIFIPVNALALFLPTIINALGFKAAIAQLLIVPPYIIALPLALATSIVSDKYMIRGPFVMFWVLWGVAGFAILIGTKSPGAGYAGAVLATVGAVAPVPVSLAWMGNNMAGDLKRGIGFAIVLGGVNYLGIVASFTYRVANAPRYAAGHAVVMSFMCATVVLSILAMLIYHNLNKRRIVKCKQDGIDASRVKDFVDDGDASPLFRYTL